MAEWSATCICAKSNRRLNQKYAWDYYKGGDKISGDQVFTSKAESRCSYWK